MPDTHTVSVVSASKLAVGDVFWASGVFARVASLEPVGKHVNVQAEDGWTEMYFLTEQVLRRCDV